MKSCERRPPVATKLASLAVFCGATVLLGVVLFAGWIRSPAAARTGTLAPMAERDPATKTPIEGRTSHEAPVIRIADERYNGVIRADLDPDHANFADRDYNTIIFNVGSLDRARLIAWAAEELQASRQVVLDSDGSEIQINALSDIATAIAGAGQKAEGIVIFKSEDGGMNLTPLETEATHGNRESAAGSRLPRGNTARHVLGKSHPLDR